MPILLGCLAATLASIGSAAAADTLEWNGFTILRGTTQTGGPFRDADPVSGGLQLGLDWRPSLWLTGHVHLLARTDDGDSTRGRLGIPEAYLEGRIGRHDNRLRVRAGAFFLPTSQENVDSLWESPYTVTPSALNSWLGEELRPLGADVSYSWRHSLSAGATVYRGNDTFGALPAGRGWELRDHWTLLGEHVPVDDQYFSSVSAETDGRLGWSGRVGWNSDRAQLQYTHIDNKSDALQHGQLFNWDTQFDIASGTCTIREWTIAGEGGWGTTRIIVEGVPFDTNLSTVYLLASRRLSGGRLSIRVEEFHSGQFKTRALTAAWFLSPRGRMRTGLEVSTAGGHRRAILEIRYSFSKS